MGEPAGEPAGEQAGDDVRRPRLWLHIGLFLVTFLTTTATGAIHAHAQGGILPIADGLSFSLPLLLILVCHELGHYLVARVYGVDASLPYFIPLPPSFGFGTMGAVIGMRAVTSDRKKLIDIGAAGPLAGLLVAIPVIVYGLMHSQVGPMVSGDRQEGNSILYAILKLATKGEWLPGGGRDVYLHPSAWAGWAGLLVTMINLLPIGQLDGGHIAVAYFGNRYNQFARWLHRSLPVVALAVFAWVLHAVKSAAGGGWSRGLGLAIAGGAALPWVIWFALISIIRRISGDDHPPVNDRRPLPASRRALFWLMVVVFAAIFMPVPLGTSLAAAGP